MRILAVDTTLARCSLAVWDSDSDRTVCELSEPMQRGHAERLAGLLQQALKEANTSLSSIERIAVTVGPGTFTGVRIGLAFTRGLALVLGIPLIGITTLRALAAGVTDNSDDLPIAVVMDARRDAVFTQTFSQSGDALNQPECLPLDEAAARLTTEKHLLVGSGSRLLESSRDNWQQSIARHEPDCTAVARLALAESSATTPVNPVYLRPPDAKPQRRMLKKTQAEFVIRSATSLHADVLSALHAACFPEAWSADDVRKLLETPGMFALLAVDRADRSVPLGFILARAAADEAEIVMLCVDIKARRRGVGAGLVDRMNRQLVLSGASRLFLEVGETNLAARALYGLFGFEPVGRRKAYYSLQNGHRSDALIMELKNPDAGSR